MPNADDPSNPARKLALAAVWTLMPTVGGLLGFLAIGWYRYLLVSALTGFITWSALSERRSRKTFLVCVAIAAIAGTLSGVFFRLPDGSVSDNGLMLVFLPSLTVIGFLAMKIYSIEAGEDE